MELYVNPTITDFRQDVNGDIKMLKIGANKEDAYANIIGQAEGGDLDNNKAATIDVSTYTEPVVINPTEGKDGMKKATITLSNIPSGIEGVYGAATSGYSSGVLIITDSSDVGDIMEYTGSEGTFADALEDTENWSSLTHTISSSVNGINVEGAERFQDKFLTITIDDALYDISDLSSSFSELSPYVSN